MQVVHGVNIETIPAMHVQQRCTNIYGNGGQLRRNGQVEVTSVTTYITLALQLLLKAFSHYFGSCEIVAVVMNYVWFQIKSYAKYATVV